MNAIQNIDSPEEHVDFDFSTSRHNSPVVATTTYNNVQVDTIPDSTIENNAGNTDDNMRVSDFLVNQDSSGKVNAEDSGNIRQTNLHDSALLLARDRARKTLQRSKKSNIISSIMDNNINFQPRVTIRDSNSEQSTFRTRDRRDESLSLLSERQAENAARRIERQRDALDDLRMRQKIEDFYAEAMPTVAWYHIIGTARVWDSDLGASGSLRIFFFKCRVI